MNPEVRLFQDLDSLSQAAAHLFVEQAGQSIEERNRFLVALNGGSTPQRLFQLLAAQYSARVDWSRTHVFWGDERCVPIDNTESSYGQAWNIWLRHVNIPEVNIHRVNGELRPAEAADDYALVLKQFASQPLAWPRFDLVLLGLGKDGHTASLFPGSPVQATAPVIAVTGHYENRPAERVTLTPLAFNSSRLVVLMAAGEDKADILGRVLGSSRDPGLYPAQRIDPKDGKLIWLVDQLAAKNIRR